jgi:predicted dehydrogenase
MGPAIHAAADAELAAIATGSPDKAAPFRRFAPRLRVHEGYEALLADPEIDAVYIPLPNHLHATWTERALAAGKAVLCEKPVGMSVAEIDRLIAARDAADLPAAEAYMILHHPQWPLTRALIADGAIGEVVDVAGVFTYDNRDPANIRNKAETGGGGLRDIGVYPLGAARYAMQAEPAGWSARATWETGVDTTLAASADLGSARFAFRVSMRAARWQEMTFHGTEGLIRLSAPFTPNEIGTAQVTLMRTGRETVTEVFPTAAQYVTQVEAFGATLRTGATYPVPLEFSRGTQAAIDDIVALVSQDA